MDATTAKLLEVRDLSVAFRQGEREALAFHRKVRRGYLEILRAEPKRVRLIRAGAPPDVVETEVRAIVEEFLRGA